MFVNKKTTYLLTYIS